jgi:ribosomal protein L29
MNKKLDPLREKNAAELKDEETRLRKELFDLEFKHSTRQLTDTMAIRRNRRQIARVATLHNQLTHSQPSDTKATK